MNELDYYELISYQEFLLSSRRKQICPPEIIMNQIELKQARNVVDFGMGLGFFTPFLQAKMAPDSWLWGAECQPDLIDLILKRKVQEDLQNFSVFYMEKTDHPMLPQWVPIPEIIFAAMSLSTFPDPGLAMDGLIRSMKPGGRLIILDWTKAEFQEGPPIKDKISMDKMKYLAEFYYLEIIKSYTINEYVYGLEVKAGKDFTYGLSDFRE
ncbi:MAG: methyltransferase domain-containing protein [Leptospiraceae bacterium]|nr:methyltransferase domain-containing protein [Leptospiraceae bacterium]